MSLDSRVLHVLQHYFPTRRSSDRRFQGRALILPPDRDEALMIAKWVRATNGPEYPVYHVAKIDTTSITPLLSPAHVFADPPRNPDEIRSTNYQKYGVRPIRA